MGDIRGLTGQWLGLRRLASRLAWVAKRPIYASLRVLDEFAGTLVEVGVLYGSLAILDMLEATLVEKDRLRGSLVSKGTLNGTLV